MEGGRNGFDMNRRAGDVLRRVNRLVEGPLTRKKLLLMLLFAIFIILYLGPSLGGWFYGTNQDEWAGLRQRCQRKHLGQFVGIEEYDVNVRLETKTTSRHDYVPYVGNGLLALALDGESHLNIKHGRTLSLPVYYHPLYVIKDPEMKEFTVTDYKNGIVHQYQCGQSGYEASYKYYAHRTIPALFVQEIWVYNPTKANKYLKFTEPRVSNWPTAVKKKIKLHKKVDAKREYEVVTGTIEIPDSDNVLGVAVVTTILPPYKVLPGESVGITIYTTVAYSMPIKKSEYSKFKDLIEDKATKEMAKVVAVTESQVSVNKMREKHTRTWQALWKTGFYISDSKAEGVVNGDHINATIYAILSQVQSYEHVDTVANSTKIEVHRTLSYPEGCYEGYSTLDAFNLWKPLNTLQNLNAVASIWLLTLEKQGCHNLLKAGASGVNQAMILSFGSFRFSNQHLEYNIHPSKLHRDFSFHRINYGNMTHVNISVIVQEDNKAAIFVALDRSDKTYYACDAGCLDSPIQLGPYRKYFPVKLTEPLTAILYITADKQHMEDLRHAIHVKEVVEAPAHEHHVIALHKHGHSLGGLNPLFWVSIIVLIVVFHLFLCRIIMNEFCDNGVSYRRLVMKP